MTNTVTLKRVAYGFAKFDQIRQENFAYVDKTRYIEVLENFYSHYPFIIRPRRFGKTLFTQTLQAYYDIAAAKDFETNFAGTYIGEHKTARASSYRVLHLDFSGIRATNFEVAFKNKVKKGLGFFCSRNGFTEGLKLVEETPGDATDLMDAFVTKYANTFSEKIYLIIDEYDQGPNDVLATSLKAFQGLTGASGLLKSFYSSLKDSATNGPIERIFITGVTSIQLDSMTSGFSIAENITNEESLSSMFGFTETELRNLVPQLIDLKKYGKTLDEVICRMKEWYNGYSFNPDVEETVFNSSMCLNYLKNIARNNREPSNMLDSSVANSLDKIESVLCLGDKDYVREIVEKSLNNEPIAFKGELQLLNRNKCDGLDREALLSALFYMGFLTFVTGNRNQLIVPNRAIGIQFFEYYFKNVLQAPDYTFDNKEFEAADKALSEGNPEPWLRLTDARLNEDSGIHVSAHVSEAALQMVLSATLWFSANYRGRLEFESRGENSGYIDLLLRARNPKYSSYVIELKQLTRDAKEDEINAALDKAKDQAVRYANGKEIKDIPNLKSLALVYKGVKLARFEVF